MNYRTRTAPRRAGFSLLEVLVAVLVLSLGLLGLAALKIYSLQNNQSANYRTIATNLGYEMLDSMRANRLRMAQYNGALDEWTGVCEAPEDEPPAACTAADADPVACDIARWQDSMCRLLPNGRGRVDVDLLNITSSAQVWYEVRVDVCWSDDRATFEAVTDDCDPEAAGGEALVSVQTAL